MQVLKLQKITKSKEYKSILKNGKKIIGKNVIIFYQPSNELVNKIGYIVSAKVGGAVTRNKVKRQLKNIITEQFLHNCLNNCNNTKLSSFFKLCFIAKRGSAVAGYNNLYLELQRAISHAKI